MAGGDTDPSPEKAPSLPDKELCLEPDVDFCSLDKDLWYGDLWWLSNIITGEAAPVVAGDDICLSMDEAGFAFAGEGDLAPQWASDIFSMSVYTTMDGEHVFVSRSDGARGAQAVFSSRMHDFVQRMELALPVGHTKQRVRIALDVLPLAHHGCRVHFSLASVYSALGLAKARHASQWVHKRLSGFMSGLYKAGLGGHLSRPWSECHKQQRKKGAGATIGEECAFLSSPSASSCGLLYLLMQWGYRSKFQGGFGCESDQSAAKEMLDGMMRVVAPELQRLNLALAGHGHWAPPRPLIGHGKVSITIGAGGVFEFLGLPPDLSADQVSFLQGKLQWATGTTSLVGDFVRSVCELCFNKE